MNALKKKVLAVVGPTASGKTGVAVRLSSLYNGEVVSCDSVQVYRHLNIGSAKPSAGETEGIKYHLIDMFEPDKIMDAGIYKKLAESKIMEILERGRLPIVSGGTGMYFNSLYYGLFSGPSRNDEIRKSLAARAEGGNLHALFEELTEKDPETAASISQNDWRRIVRALEVYYLTGRPVSQLRRTNLKLDLDWYIIGLDCDRKVLYENIEKRIDSMIFNGLVEETGNIINRYGKNAFALSSIGYRHAVNYISGLWSFEEFKYYLKRDTRRYSKRQLTWFKKNRDIHWFDPQDFEGIRMAVEGFL